VAPLSVTASGAVRSPVIGTLGRESALLFLTAVTLASVGFFAGASPDPIPPLARPAPGAGEARAFRGESLSYAELRGTRRGANQGMYAGAIAGLAGPTPDPFAPLAKLPGDLDGAVAARATRRAYAGAPPTIPHPIQQQSAASCLACHEAGVKIGEKVAPRMGHAPYASCTQCHVTSIEPRPWRVGVTARDGGEGRLLAVNTFAGLPSFGRGDRAHPGAPPTVPHPTLMRARCETCHGPEGLLGLRTPHPYRQSCSQCHAPSARLDQRVAWEPVR
jgi:cytochrome c-type protein NapB